MTTVDVVLLWIVGVIFVLAWGYSMVRIVGHYQQYRDRLASKLRQSEDHLTRELRGLNIDELSTTEPGRELIDLIQKNRPELLVVDRESNLIFTRDNAPAILGTVFDPKQLSSAGTHVVPAISFRPRIADLGNIARSHELIRLTAETVGSI